MRQKFMGAVAALAVMAALVPVRANAQISDQWQFSGTLYGYFPSIGGTTKFPASGTDIDVSADKIIDSLKFVFMGTLTAQKGRWGAFTDVLYMDVGGTKSNTRDFNIDGHPLPVGASGAANLDLKATVWTLAGSYRALAKPGTNVDIFAGARLLDIKTTLNWQFTGNIDSIPVGARGGEKEISKNFWDGVVGVKGRVGFGDERRWFVPYYLDIGTGNSELTWQAMGGIGYSFGWGDAFAAYRFLDYKMKSGSKIEDLSLSGPMIAAVFRW